MAITTLGKSKRSSIKELREEVALLRSFVIGQIGKDIEGEYKPEFVERVLEAAKNNKAEYVFKDKKSFLNYLNEHKD